MQEQELRRKTEALRWYHTIDLGQGVVTAGVDNTPERLARLHLPGDLSGRSVLDIGAWDGFFSFEAERRNAARVVATDAFYPARELNNDPTNWWGPNHAAVVGMLEGGN